jgi:predicted metalloprotease
MPRRLLVLLLGSAAIALALAADAEATSKDTTRVVLKQVTTAVPTEAARSAGVSRVSGSIVEEESALKGLPKAPRPTKSAHLPHIRGVSGLTLNRYLTLIDGDVSTFWRQEFDGSGFKYTPAVEHIITKTGRTRCSGTRRPTFVTTFEGPFYCWVDRTLNLTLGFFRREIAPIGTAATAVVVAHENGHRVQDLLGILRAKASGSVLTIETELQADCLAGVYLYSLGTRKLLERRDIRDALTVTAAAGDPPGTPESDPSAHGTPTQRVRALGLGATRGVPNDCAIAKIKTLL